MTGKWKTYLYGFARWAANNSKDSTKVGAALVGPKLEVRLTAYNGPPRGVRDTSDRLERPRKYLFASHAESGNATASRRFSERPRKKRFVTRLAGLARNAPARGRQARHELLWAIRGRKLGQQIHAASPQY